MPDERYVIDVLVYTVLLSSSHFVIDQGSVSQHQQIYLILYASWNHIRSKPYAAVTSSRKSPFCKIYIRLFSQNWVGSSSLVTVTGSMRLLRGSITLFCCENCLAWLLRDGFMWRCDCGIRKWVIKMQMGVVNMSTTEINYLISWSRMVAINKFISAYQLI